MSEIYLTAVSIRYASDNHSILPDDACLFVEVLVDGKKVKRTGQLAKQSTGSSSSWRLDENIEVTDHLSSTTLEVVMESPKDNYQQLGFTDLVNADLLAHSTEEKYEFVQALTKTIDCPPLLFVFSCVVIPPDIPPAQSSDSFEDPIEEEAFDHQLNLARILGQITVDDDIIRSAAQVRYELALQLSSENHEKPLRLMHAGDLFIWQYQRSLKSADLDKAIIAYNAAVELLPDDHELQDELRRQLGLALIYQFNPSNDIENVGSSTAHISDGTSDEPARLNNLGISFQNRFEHSGNIVDMDQAISAYEEAVHLTPDNHADKPSRLNNLGTSYTRRFQHSGGLVDIDKAISALEQATHLTPDSHGNKLFYLNNLGISFKKRFQRSGDLVDIGKAISAQEKAIHLMPDGHTDEADLLSNMGSFMSARFGHLGDLADINKAISAHQHALSLTPNGHASMPDRLYNLGICLEQRFERSGDLVDIDKAISVHERALHLTPDGHANKPDDLSSLGRSLVARFERSGDLVDIEKAISFHQQAVRLTPNGHIDEAGRQSHLGWSVFRRFERLGDLVDLSKAISAHERAVHLTPDGHAAKPGRLNKLGNSFLRRFERSGDVVDVDMAINAHQTVVDLTPDSHANKPDYLNNVGNSYLRRFDRLGEIADINKAVFAYEQATHLTPDAHVSMSSRLHNLGISFQHRFEHSGDVSDVENAISTHKQALYLNPNGHTNEASYLSSLGISYSHRFQYSGDLADIDNAISAQEQAVQLTPNGHAAKAGFLGNLGNSLLGRFEHSGDLADVENAIFACQQAVHLTPDGHAAMPGCLHNLGKSHLQRFERSGDLADSSAAVSHFQHAATYPAGSPSIQFHAALSWARLCHRVRISSPLPGYTVALDLLPRVVWLGQTIQARYRELTSIGHIASEAAAAAISVERYDTALEWLEQGRSIVWGQLLHLRTPVDVLREVQPRLADELIHVSKALEHSSSRDAGFRDLPTRSDRQQSMEEVAQGHRRLAEKWEKLVKTVRDIPGFEDFLRPKDFLQLCSAARTGPVVVVNVHKYRCDALVLIAGLDEVMHIPLDHFSYAKALKLHQSLDKLLLAAGVRARETRTMRRVMTTTGADFPTILSDLWAFVVKPVLDGLAFTSFCAEDPPRIWWCATGPLAFLPIHAAGIYNDSAAGHNISDYVVSSYTPTLNALLNAATYHERRRNFRGLLLVSQPNTPGQSALPNTTVELAEIQKQTRDFHVHVLEGPVALVESVVEGMKMHSWLHLACHALQDVVEPTRSAFCLHDGHLELSTIITKSFPDADFAFLSACQTATGAEKLPDEAVHLAAGLMLAGYSGVIATMWSIMDKDAPVITGQVYSELFSAVQPDSTKAALALHHAVKRLRQEGGDTAFWSWVPFIHVGI